LQQYGTTINLKLKTSSIKEIKQVLKEPSNMYLCFAEESLKGTDNTEDDKVDSSTGNYGIL